MLDFPRFHGVQEYSRSVNPVNSEVNMILLSRTFVSEPAGRVRLSMQHYCTGKTVCVCVWRTHQSFAEPFCTIVRSCRCWLVRPPCSVTRFERAARGSRVATRQVPPQPINTLEKHEAHKHKLATGIWQRGRQTIKHSLRRMKSCSFVRVAAIVQRDEGRMRSAYVILHHSHANLCRAQVIFRLSVGNQFFIGGSPKEEFVHASGTCQETRAVAS